MFFQKDHFPWQIGVNIWRGIWTKKQRGSWKSNGKWKIRVTYTGQWRWRQVDRFKNSWGNTERLGNALAGELGGEGRDWSMLLQLPVASSSPMPSSIHCPSLGHTAGGWIPGPTLASLVLSGSFHCTAAGGGPGRRLEKEPRVTSRFLALANGGGWCHLLRGGRLKEEWWWGVGISQIPSGIF